ncbi:MAG: NACHT domain-containing protein [Campylobacteraceae bacterium]|nr:NACHT domain-containing protein [Campylobacteraceae bacterium]
MNNPLIEHLKYKCTVRIEASGKIGTGFFIAKDKILTCYHVVKKSDNIKIYWNNKEFILNKDNIQKHQNSDIDLALIEYEFNNKDSVALDDTIKINDTCFSYGFPQNFKENGDTLTYLYEECNDDLLKFKDGHFIGGFSGSAILNTQNSKVCGIVSRSRNKDFHLGGRGISTSKIIFNNLNLDVKDQISKWQELSESLEYKLQSKYLNKFNTISFLIDKNKRNIEDIYINLAIILEDKKEDKKEDEKYFHRDSIINNYEEIQKPKKIINIEDIVNKSSVDNKTRAMIYGKAGVGKTTLCQYIVYNWAKGKLYQEFKYVIYVKLRNLKKDGVFNLIRRTYIDLYSSKNIHDELKPHLSKTLFLFDGYDELNSELANYFKGEIENIPNYILTSRPYGYHKSNFEINQYFETIGFTNKNVVNYVNKFYNHKKDLSESLNNYLDTNLDIKQISYIPLMLEMISSLWDNPKYKDIFTNNSTMTDLYSNIIDYIFYEYTKINDTKYLQNKKTDIFNLLGELAYEGLIQQTIIINKKMVKKTVGDKITLFSDFVLKSGFLKSNLESVSEVLNNYEFLHLSFQEYFAALYVSKLEESKLKEIIYTYKYFPHMQLFFYFLGGVIEQKEFFLDSLGDEPKDLTKVYQPLLIFNCLKEIKEDQIQSTYISKANQDIINIIYLFIRKDIPLRDLFSNVNYVKNDELLEELISIIKNEKIKGDTRVTILEALVRHNIQDKDILKSLTSTLKDKSIEIAVRKAITKVLAKQSIQNNDLLKNLIDMLRDESINIVVRVAIVEALCDQNINDDLLKNLIDMLNNENINIDARVAIVRALGDQNIQDDDLLKNLIDMLKDQTLSGYDRIYIENTFEKQNIQDNNVLKSLIFMLKDKNIDGYARKYTIQILTRHNIQDKNVLKNLIDTIKDESINQYIRGDIAKVLSRQKIQNNNLVKSLIDILKDERIYEFTRGDIAKSLARHNIQDKKVLKSLIDILKDERIYEFTRRDIAKSLARHNIQDKKVFKSFIAIIKNKSIYEYSRGDIAKTLAKQSIQNKDLLRNLLDMIKDESINEDTRGDIAKTLAKNKDLLKNLINMIKDESINIYTRRDIAEALAKQSIQNKDLLKSFIAIIKSESISKFVRVYISKALAKQNIQDKDLLKSFIDIVKDENVDQFERVHISKALARQNIQDKNLLRSLVNITKDESISRYERVDIERALTKYNLHNKDVFKSFIAIIKNERIHNFTSKEITDALSHQNIQNNDLLESLISIIKNENIDSYTRSDIVKALAKQNIQDNNVLKSLIIILKDESIFHLTRRDIAKDLAKQNILNDEHLETLFSIIQDENIHECVRDTIADIVKIDINGYLNKIPNILLEKISHDQHPLFIKDEKLNIIIDGKLISSKEKATKQFFDDIENFFNEKKFNI